VLLRLTGAYEQAFCGVGRKFSSVAEYALRGEALWSCLTQERTTCVHPCMLD
jgi:hypothetical protein